jgi:hypothetical protein
VTTLACFPNFGEFIGIESITLSLRPHGRPTVFVGGMGGTVSEIDQSTSPPTVTPIASLDTRIDGMAVGPDGCLYVTQSTAIDKLTNADGSCSLRAASILPSLSLRPRRTIDQRVGRIAILVARVHNTDHPGGTPITFHVAGANPLTRTVASDRAGVAVFIYRGSHAGADSVTATATAAGIALASTATTVDWIASSR